MPVDPRTPVLIGYGQVNHREDIDPERPSIEPLDLMVAAVRQAGDARVAALPAGTAGTGRAAVTGTAADTVGGLGDTVTVKATGTGLTTVAAGPAAATVTGVGTRTQPVAPVDPGLAV